MDSAAVTLLILISVQNGPKNQDLVPAKSEEVIQAGSRVTLKCVGNGTVKWIIQDKKPREIYNDMIDLPNARYVDTRTYRCKYTAPDSTESASVHLFVKDSSNYWNNLQPNLMEVYEGQDLLIPCLLTDPSIPSSAVYLEPSDSFAPQINVSFDAKKGFTMRKVQMAINGHVFSCTALVNGNKIKMSSRKVKIYVSKEETIPSVSMASYTYIRIQGEKVIFTCNATSNVKSSIEWEHNTKKKITMRPIIDPKDDFWITTSILTIQNVSFEDIGNYTCIASTQAGSNRTSANLRVIEKAFVNLSTSQTKNVTLLKGVSVELNVDIEAYPSHLSWSWIHKSTTNTTDVSSLSRWEDRGPYRNKSTLVLNRLNENEGGTYTFFANNSLTSALLSFEIKLYSAPTVDIDTVNGTQEIRCVSQGNPPPNITWLQCPDISCSEEERDPLTGEESLDVWEDRVISSIRPIYNLSTITIFCTASNIAGDASTKISLTNIFQSVPFVMHSTAESQQFSPMMIAVATAGVFFLLLSVFLLYKYKQKPKYEIRWQMLQMSEDNQYISIDPTQMPYNERWEFPRTNLQFGKTIGAGAFGKVMEATAFGMGQDDSALRVAVKMLKPSAHTDEKEALMSELKILSHLGHHENIVNLLGACTSGGPILVITEYCQHGDLLNFLRKKAEAMNNIFTAVLANCNGDYKNMAVEQKYLGSDSGLGSQNKDHYIDMKPVASHKGSTSDNPLVEEEDMDDHLPLDLHDLLHFSLQVAQGMSFLASKNCIHRDVAARNVLVTQGRLAKICDFGLARDIENDSNYVVKGNARLPVKWMAPESIFDCIYTVQSDVWSYGILLWEIFSLGRSPYPGVVVNRKFYKMIKDGNKMDCPDYAPLDIYRIMKACWDLEPTHRPTFTQITDLINKQMGLITDQDYTNIIQGQQEEDCADTKCVDSQPAIIKGNNYQFC